MPGILTPDVRFPAVSPLALAEQFAAREVQAKRRLRAPIAEIEQRAAEAASLVGEVVGDARAREHDDADRQRFEDLKLCLFRPRNPSQEQTIRERAVTACSGLL
jgi:hypothetical protein